MALSKNSIIALEEILEKHKKWLNGGEEGERANLCYADLRDADLRYANLREADLRYADLYGANLYCANLSDASLYGANLSNANLHNVDLHNAELCRAKLRDVDLRNANLYNANFYSVDLYGADLSDANLFGAYLRDAIIEDKVLNSVWPMCCPESGSFIGWKKAKDKIIKLEICEDALRSSAFGRKCRCSKAKVVSIENIDGSISSFPAVESNYDKTFIYIVGETVEVKDFDTDRKNECAPGIHFFITRKEAVEYAFR